MLIRDINAKQLLQKSEFPELCAQISGQELGIDENPYVILTRHNLLKFLTFKPSNLIWVEGKFYLWQNYILFQID